MSGLSFSILQTLLKPSQKLALTVTRLETGLDVVVQPVIGAEPKNLPDDLAALRAVLATPLCLRDTAENLDANFIERVTKYQGARAPALEGESAMLQEIEERGRQATNAHTAKRGATSTTAAKPSAANKDTNSKDDHDEEDGDDDDATTAAPNASTIGKTTGTGAKPPETGTADLFGTP